MCVCVCVCVRVCVCVCLSVRPTSAVFWWRSTPTGCSTSTDWTWSSATRDSRSETCRREFCTQPASNSPLSWLSPPFVTRGKRLPHGPMVFVGNFRSSCCSVSLSGQQEVGEDCGGTRDIQINLIVADQLSYYRIITTFFKRKNTNK